MSDSDNSMNENNEMDPEDTWGAESLPSIPDKSRERYENTYKIFKKWCETNNCAKINEEAMLSYFVERNKKLKSPGSLWAEYSMLKTTIFLHDSINITKFPTLTTYLKRKNVGYKPKKASVFTKEDMSKFLVEAPDEKFLIHKVAMILGILGGCRREDLYNLSIQDIEDHEVFIIVKILNSTRTNIQRTFTITNQEDEKINYLEFYRKYINLRPKNAKSAHFFMNFRNGKCTNQVVGKGTVGSWPTKIAQYLKLQNPKDYTSHSYRRTAAMFVTGRGLNGLGMKMLGSWKPSPEREIQREEDLECKLEFSEKILRGDSPCSDISCPEFKSFNSANISSASNTTNFTIKKSCSETGSEEVCTFPISFNNCSNCTFNFHINK